MIRLANMMNNVIKQIIMVTIQVQLMKKIIETIRSATFEKEIWIFSILAYIAMC